MGLFSRGKKEIMGWDKGGFLTPGRINSQWELFSLSIPCCGWKGIMCNKKRWIPQWLNLRLEKISYWQYLNGHNEDELIPMEISFRDEGAPFVIAQSWCKIWSEMQGTGGLGSLSHIGGNQHPKLLRDVTAAMNSTGYQYFLTFYSGAVNTLEKKVQWPHRPQSSRFSPVDCRLAFPFPFHRPFSSSLWDFSWESRARDCWSLLLVWKVRGSCSRWFKGS